MEDEPPQSRTKVTVQQEEVDGQMLLEDLKLASYSTEQAQIAVTSYKKIKDPLFPTPLQVKPPVMSPRGSQKKGVRLIISKHKTVLKTDSESTEKSDPISFMNQKKF